MAAVMEASSTGCSALQMVCVMPVPFGKPKLGCNHLGVGVQLCSKQQLFVYSSWQGSKVALPTLKEVVAN